MVKRMCFVEKSGFQFWLQAAMTMGELLNLLKVPVSSSLKLG